jgi:hypothetical protein
MSRGTFPATRSAHGSVAPPGSEKPWLFFRYNNRLRLDAESRQQEVTCHSIGSLGAMRF